MLFILCFCFWMWRFTVLWRQSWSACHLGLLKIKCPLQHWQTGFCLPVKLNITAHSWLIPLKKDLLSQGQCTTWHSCPNLWKLNVGLLDGTPAVQDTFSQARASSRVEPISWSVVCSLSDDLLIKKTRWCLISVVHSFLQEKLEWRLSSFTLKVSVAAIFAHCDTVNGRSLRNYK